MKKTFALLSAVFILISAMPAAAAGYMLSAYYDISGPTLLISGRIGSERGVLVTAMVDHFSDGQNGFSEDNLPLSAQLFTTGDEGWVSLSIPLAPDMPEGKYNIYLNSAEQGKFQTHFYVVKKESAAVQNALAAVNGASASEMRAVLEQNSQALGIDTGMGNLNLAARLMHSWKGGGYTAATFYDCFNAAQAVILLQSKDLQDVISMYGISLGTDIGSYNTLDAQQKTELGKILADADFSAAMPKQVYKDSRVLAVVKASKTWIAAKENVMLYKDDIGISMTEYNKLTDTKQNEVFIAFYKGIKNFKKISDIKNAFEQAVADAGKAQEPSSPGGATSPGGNYGTPGRVEGGSNILVPPAVTPDPTPPPADKFSDLSGHFSEDYVKSLADAGVISGYPDGSFKPENAVTRAEFSKMLVMAFALEGDVIDGFSDVFENDWFAPYVGTLAGLGIAKGDNGNFRPSDNIKRQDAAVMVARILAKGAEERPLSFEDAEAVDEYAVSSVAFLAGAEILQGDGINFYPQNSITRGEVAVLIFKSMSYQSTEGGE